LAAYACLLGLFEFALFSLDRIGRLPVMESIETRISSFYKK
jgi:hypothetical protein